jgi:hypothetical protein
VLIVVDTWGKGNLRGCERRPWDFLYSYLPIYGDLVDIHDGWDMGVLCVHASHLEISVMDVSS